MRYACHANPHRLLDLAEQAHKVNTSTLKALAHEFSRILHDVRVGGVWKRTQPGRLPLTENAMVTRLAHGNGPGEVLDIGASDGSTSFDLLHALKAGCDRKFHVHMADLYLWLDVWRNGSLMEYRSTDGKPVMARVGRFGMRLPTSEHRWDLPGNILAKLYLSLTSMREAMVCEARIPMINPLALAEGDITPIEMNCLNDNAEMRSRFDAVRASNILNHEYFSPDQLRQILGYLHSYLHPDGVLVVSRNEGGVDSETENGTVWRRKADGFAREDSFGAGSEIAAIVDALKVDLPCAD